MTGEEQTASTEIDAIIASLDDWRGPVMAHVRALIHRADPDVVETVKWKKPSNPAGVATFEHGGIICTLQTFGEGVAANTD